MIDGDAVATGVGRRKLDAERMAAAEALELEELPGIQKDPEPVDGDN